MAKDNDPPNQGAFPFDDEQPRRKRRPPKKPPVLDDEAARAAKKEGMARAARNSDDWLHDAMGEFRMWLRQQKAAGVREIQIEEFRAVSCCQPPKHNVWGSFATAAERAGLLRGLYHSDGSTRKRRTRSVKTHSHETRLWEIV